MHRRREARGAQTLAKRLGLRLVAADALTIRRRRCGKGWTYLDPDNRVIRERATVQRLARLAVPPAYADVLYAQDPRRASPGRRARCRRPAAIPLSSGLGEGARDPQGASPRAARGRAAAHPPQRRPASVRRRADARIRLRRGDRAGGAQRHPAGHRKLRATARHPRCGHAVEVERHHLRREHHADVSLQGRQDHRQGGQRAAPRGRDHAAAGIAGSPPVSVPRRQRRRAPRHRARGERVPARDRRRAHLAQGFPHAAGVGERARDAGAYRAGRERAPAAQAGAGGGARRGRRSAQHARDLPQELCQRHRGRRLRGGRAGAVLADAQGVPLAAPPRAGAGQDHRGAA